MTSLTLAMKYCMRDLVCDVSYAWFSALRFRSSVAVSPCSVAKVRNNYVRSSVRIPQLRPT